MLVAFAPLFVLALADLKTLGTKPQGIQFEFTADFFFFKTESYLPQSGIELTVQQRIVFNFF